jgi:5-methylcytosine-specific restriction endonuclease McrA
MPHKGFRHSAASKQKIAEGLTGRSVSEETREKLRRAMKRRGGPSKKQREQTSRTLKRKYRKGEIAAWNTGLQMDDETKKHLAALRVGMKFPEHRGEANHFWKGGAAEHTNLVQRRRLGPHQKWRLSVYERDGYACRHCGEKGNRDYGVNGVGLDTCHIKPWMTFPKLRYTLSNGITLCRSCHIEFDKQNRRGD